MKHHITAIVEQPESFAMKEDTRKNKQNGKPVLFHSGEFCHLRQSPEPEASSLLVTRD